MQWPKTLSGSIGGKRYERRPPGTLARGHGMNAEAPTLDTEACARFIQFWMEVTSTSHEDRAVQASQHSDQCDFADFLFRRIAELRKAFR
jgi:hypothetical protein